MHVSLDAIGIMLRARTPHVDATKSPPTTTSLLPVPVPVPVPTIFASTITMTASSQSTATRKQHLHRSLSSASSSSSASPSQHRHHHPLSATGGISAAADGSHHNHNHNNNNNHRHLQVPIGSPSTSATFEHHSHCNKSAIRRHPPHAVSRSFSSSTSHAADGTSLLLLQPRWIRSMAVTGIVLVLLVHVYLARNMMRLYHHNTTQVENSILGKGHPLDTIIKQQRIQQERNRQANNEASEGSDRHERRMEKDTVEQPIIGQPRDHAATVLGPPLEPIVRPIDLDQYTIRINTWKRPELLQLSIHHYEQCPGVAQIQIVWCLEQGDPPDWLVQRERQPSTQIGSNRVAAPVVVERHDINSLNERFLILLEPPTIAILSIDDDVLRPCLALDVAFDKWTFHPSRMVGFDARSHVVVTNQDTKSNTEPERWIYAYKSTTEKSNEYSTTLTRFTFIHRDYLRSYMTNMPAAIRDFVHSNFNCEDIAMSLWVSAQSDGQPPLLADAWATQTLIKLYSDKGGISTNDSSKHKALRDQCMNQFATALHLKPTTAIASSQQTQPKSSGSYPILQKARLSHGTYFEYGALTTTDKIENPHNRSVRMMQMAETIQRWKSFATVDLLQEQVSLLRLQTMEEPYRLGLIEKTPPWKERFVSSTPAQPKNKSKR